ncbi:unnamed protein product [Alternaria alternata]
MPLWVIYHPEGTFEDDASKEALAADSIKQYTNIGLPAFYIVTNFIKVPKNNEDKVYKGAANGVDAVLKKHCGDKGYNYEFHIDETERRLWKINGIFPPAFGSEEEKIWVKENRAVDFGKPSSL